MSYKHFQNKDCEYFPCHQIDNKSFNCIFCYCPLYQFDDCGGTYDMLPNGWKDCSKCIIPHNEDMYDYITHKLVELNNTKLIKEGMYYEK